MFYYIYTVVVSGRVAYQSRNIASAIANSHYLKGTVEPCLRWEMK